MFLELQTKNPRGKPMTDQTQNTETLEEIAQAKCALLECVQILSEVLVANQLVKPEELIERFSRQGLAHTVEGRTKSAEIMKYVSSCLRDRSQAHDLYRSKPDGHA